MVRFRTVVQVESTPSNFRWHRSLHQVILELLLHMSDEWTPSVSLVFWQHPAAMILRTQRLFRPIIKGREDPEDFHFHCILEFSIQMQAEEQRWPRSHMWCNFGQTKISCHEICRRVTARSNPIFDAPKFQTPEDPTDWSRKKNSLRIGQIS